MTVASWKLRKDRRPWVYIAAPFELRKEAIRVKWWLIKKRKYVVTSSWLREDCIGVDDEHARLDLSDVARADILLALNPIEFANKGTGGRHVELGYALALGKQIVLVGVRTNVFHHLDCVRVIERIEDL